MGDEQKIREFIQDLQYRGYSKYAATQEVMTEFELYFQKAYYRVRKYWNPPSLGKKPRV